jgi:hypothetical protein
MQYLFGLGTSGRNCGGHDFPHVGVTRKCVMHAYLRVSSQIAFLKSAQTLLVHILHGL